MKAVTLTLFVLLAIPAATGASCPSIDRPSGVEVARGARQPGLPVRSERLQTSVEQPPKDLPRIVWGEYEEYFERVSAAAVERRRIVSRVGEVSYVDYVVCVVRARHRMRMPLFEAVYEQGGVKVDQRLLEYEGSGLGLELQAGEQIRVLFSLSNRPFDRVRVVKAV